MLHSSAQWSSAPTISKAIFFTGFLETDFLRVFFSSPPLSLLSFVFRASFELDLCKTLNLNLRLKADDDLLGVSTGSGLLTFGDEDETDDIVELLVFERLCWNRRWQPAQ
jgi:hypothetical protein